MILRAVDFLFDFAKSRVDNAQVAMQNLFSQRLTPCCLRLFGSHLVTTIRDSEENDCEHCWTHIGSMYGIYHGLYLPTNLP